MRALLAILVASIGSIGAFQWSLGDRCLLEARKNVEMRESSIAFRSSTMLWAKKPNNAVKSIATAQKVGSVDEMDDFAADGSQSNQVMQSSLPDKDRFAQFYNSMVKPGKEITKDRFVQYDVVQSLLDKGLIDDEDVDDLWLAAVGDASGLTLDESYELVCMLTDIPDPQEQTFLDTEYKKLTQGTGQLSFYTFLSWSDMQQILKDEALSMEEVSSLWRDIVGDLNKKADRVLFGKLNRAVDDALEEDEDNEEDGDDYSDDEDDDDEEDDPISRLLSENVNVYDPNFDVSSAIDEETISDLEENFLSLTGGEEKEGEDLDARRLDFQSFLQWEDVQDLLQGGDMDREELLFLWAEALSNRKGGRGKAKESIDVETFLRLNLRLELYLLEREQKEQDQGGGDVEDTQPKKKAASASFSEAPALPTPRDSELSMMPTPSAEEGAEVSAVLTNEEREMMEILDKADSLLKGGAFGDFDKLIGDTEDPRLLGLRSVKEEAEGIQGDLKTRLNQLITLSKEKTRCGLDARGNVESTGEMRALFQAVLDKAPALAQTKDAQQVQKLMNGRWKLLYTSSEMFYFYNGVTGLSNVFPGSKFQSLSLEFSSDGILSETKYHEKLSTPLGGVDVTAFGTWQVLKEMSFMTNDISIISRNYCTRVTAGPFEYKAQENWKSLRSFAMNEVVYVDDKIMLMRNAGALRVFFVLERE